MMNDLKTSYLALKNEGESALSSAQKSLILSQYGSLEEFLALFPLSESIGTQFQNEAEELRLDFDFKNQLLEQFDQKQQRKAGFVMNWFAGIFQPKLSYALSLLLVASIGLSIHFSKNVSELENASFHNHELLLVDSTFGFEIDSSQVIADSLRL